MKKYFYIIMFFICIFIGVENVSAVSANDYRVGKFVYYDPVNNSYCSSDNYWTKYNQNTTCYRWAVINTHDVPNDNDVIRIMIDHDIGKSDFAGRGSAINSAIEGWKIPALTDTQKEALNLSSSNGLANLGTQMVLNLYNGNVDRKDNNGELKNLYEFNKECINLETPCYKEKDINRIRFIASNMTSSGYWLSDSIDSNNEEHKQITTNDAYEFYMDKNGQISLADKNSNKGVRLTLYIDVSILSERTYLEKEISLKNNKVSPNNKYFNLIGDNNELNFYAQGFTTIGENKHLFYLQNQNNKNKAESDGILLYINENNMNFVGGGTQNHFPFAHGNGLSYDKTNKMLYVTANEWENNVLSRFSLSNLNNNYVLENDFVQYRNKKVEDVDTNISFALATVAIDDTGNRLFSISGNQKLILWYIKRKGDNSITWDIEYSFDIPEYHGTLQNLTYMNGYLYVAVYESCKKDYQIFCYGNKHAANIYVYNAKFNPDGTPNRWFGQLVNSYYSYDFNNDNTTQEIEGIGSWGDTIYLGFAKKNLGTTDKNNDGEKDVSSYEPSVYKFDQTFYNLTYRLGNSEYTDKIIPNKFADMGLYLKGIDNKFKTHDNGFIGWKAPNGTVYTEPDKTSLRINENTTLDGVYIDLISGYSFDKNNIMISKQVAIGDLLNEIKAYNSEIKVKRNNQIVTDTNEFVKYNDTLVISSGTKELKTYNLIPTKYEVRYKDDGIEYETQANINSVISLKNDITKEGYTFIGWKDLKDNKVYKITDNYSVTTYDVVFESVWEANNYNISYNSNGGTGSMNNSSHTYDVDKALSKNTFTKTGYTFIGWSTSATGEVVYQDEQVVKNLAEAGTITLYAVWDDKSYSISYNSNGGTGSMNNSSHTYDIDKALSKNIFTKTGYTFIGWSTSTTGEVVYQDEQVVKNLAESGTITLYAKWEANNYNISYNSNGGIGSMNNSVHVYDIDKALSKNIFTKTGYTFKGWSTSSNGEVVYQDEQVVKNLTSVYEDLVTLYAVWDANKYTVVYNANSGTGSMENSIFTYDKKESLRKNTFTKSGYRFKGWSTSASGFTVYVDEDEVRNLAESGTVNLYASWEEVIEDDIDAIINSKYQIRNNKIYNIPKKTGINNLNLGLNSNYSYKIYDDANTNILTEGYVGTGNLLKVYMNNTLKKEYRVIIKGDITGEGEIEVNDVSKLYQFLKGKITMNNHYIEAGNVETSISDITVTDVAKLYQYIKGKINSLEG